MGGTSSARSFSGRKFNKNNNAKSKYPRGSFENGVYKSGKKVLESPTGWYRVTVSFCARITSFQFCFCDVVLFLLQLPYGNKYEKDYVLKILLEKTTPLPFIPAMVR